MMTEKCENENKKNNCKKKLKAYFICDSNKSNFDYKKYIKGGF